ncbi:HET-domain-containing protein [Lentithecium fluviatile CBS 122367]|uniref:HET-domain-containing protein n=1 Tax=Lentithecium fluviatile CBS 122367 TaxID=1168545 RepID=A0A6G1J0I4_9PLEO|nr:HET-domain-containing protein [Lentithecium fluviatile CBS 122367]
MQQIPFHDLSKTFKDAVVATRRLGLQYLWIDSLCIIQDSEDDWRREAASMASVYNNAVVTIAATAAKESSQGLFMPHQKVSGERVEVPYNCKERRGKGKDLGAAKMILCHRSTAYDGPDKYIERSPLNQRGWVFQERLLSKRTLHFAENQIFWECNSLFASEDGTIRDEHPELRLKQEFQTKKIRPWSSAAEEGDRSSEIELWCRIVEEYTQRSLTVDSDRLPALAGITMAMLEKLGFEPSNDDVIRENFAAGLWKSALHVGILWQACDGQLRRPSEYRAPSWSWAALEGPVRYDTWLWSSDPPSDSDSSMFAEVQVEGEYLTGRIKKAYLDLNCMIKHATYDPAEKCLVGISVDEANMPSRALFCPETQRRLGWCVLDEGTGVEKRTVCCALISRSKPSEYVRRYRNLNGTENILVLDRKGSSSVNEFVRIGIGQIDVDIDWYDLETPVETNWDLIQEPERRQKWKNRWTHVKVF